MKALLLSLALAGALNGCVALGLAAGGEAGVTAAQERSAGNKVDDAGIFLRIKNAFAHYSTNDIFANVEVKVVEGRVLLTGNVEKPESKIEAVRLTWTVNGVRELHDEISVNDQTGIGNYLQDAWISNNIRARLLAEKGVRSINYSVITTNQVVYLMGIAQDQAELNKVTHISSTAKNVQRVVSYVLMRDDTRRPIVTSPSSK